MRKRSTEKSEEQYVSQQKSSFDKKETLNLVEVLTKKSWETPFSIRVDSLTNYSYVKSVEDDLIVEPFIENALSLDEDALDVVNFILSM